MGVWTVGAAGEAADTLYAVDFTAPTAIVLGAEEHGLRRLTRERCDRLARIPLAQSGVESLNVSVAAGIFLFEARRQRGSRADRGLVAGHLQIALAADGPVSRAALDRDRAFPIAHRQSQLLIG